MNYSTSIISALAGVASLALITTTHASDKQVPIISLSATGSVQIAPDMALISVGVLREAKTARAALNANNQAMADVLASLKETGIEDRDLQTSGFNIQPKYTYPKRQSSGVQPAPTIEGYSVNNNLTIRIRDIDLTGEVLDKVVTLGVNSGGNVQFTNSDKASILKKARTRAVQSAIEKANTLTSAANIKLGKVLSINEGFSSPRPRPIAQARMSIQEDAGAVPIASGENQYSVTVQMSWELVQ